MTSTVLFHTTDWSCIAATEHAGESGMAWWFLKIEKSEHRKGIWM